MNRWRTMSRMFGLALVCWTLIGQGLHVAQGQSNNGGRSAPSLRSGSRGAGRVSRAPYMIGDSPYGPSFGNLSVSGVELSSLDHPIFNDHRFNVAEANAVMPDDRFLFSYRHFENTSSNNALGQASTVNVERFVVGMEKSFLDGMASVDFRVPLLREMSSALDLYDDGAGVSNLPGTDRGSELGNLATVIKLLLTRDRAFAVSSGVAVNIPTADDARIRQTYIDPDALIGDGSIADTTGGPTDFFLQANVDNDVVNLTPFLSWQVTPRGGFFHQGFLQVDVPLNSFDVAVDASGNISPSAVYDDETFSVRDVGKGEQQTLLRLNLALGYWMYRGNRSDLVRGIAGLFEVHYTGSLDRTEPWVTNLTTLSDPSVTEPDVPVNLVIGEGSADFDQVNLSAGCAIDLGGTLITNGVIVPVTTGANRSFDFEYNLQVNQRY